MPVHALDLLSEILTSLRPDVQQRRAEEDALVLTLEDGTVKTIRWTPFTDTITGDAAEKMHEDEVRALATRLVLALG